MTFQTGFSGVPVNFPLIKIGGNKEALKEWEELDKKKKKEKVEKKLREARNNQRVESRKTRQKKIQRSK